MTMKTPTKTKAEADAIRQQILIAEKARRAQAKAGPAGPTTPIGVSGEGQRAVVAGVEAESVEMVTRTLSSPADAVEYVESRLPSIFVAMVEQRQGLLEALKLCEVETMTFFTALDASQSLRDWYRGVKGAQAVMDVEGVGQIMAEMDEIAADESVGNGVRNASVSAARIKLDQARWAAQRLLPALFGDKTQSETHSKIEIVVRRETKKAVAQAIEDEIE